MAKKITMTSITNLVCEYRSNPLGIDVTAPRLGWQMQSDRRGARQTAYRILAAGDPQRLREGQADLWDSGKIDSDQSVHIPHAGKELGSRQRVYWQVTVWDETGQAAHSDPVDKSTVSTECFTTGHFLPSKACEMRRE